MTSDSSPAANPRDLVQAKLRAFGAAVDQLDDAVARRFGRNRTDLRVLEMLDDREPLTPSEIADATHLSNAALTAVIDRLASGGLVIRRSDPGDRRRVLVELTESARRLSRDTFAGLYRRLDELLARYSDDELAVIADCLAGARGALLSHAAELLREEG